MGRMTGDGEGSSFVRVFLEHRPRLEALAYRRTGCRATAADLVQELFVRLWRRPIDEPHDTAGYLFRSIRNLTVDHLRMQTLRAGLDARTVPEQHSADPVTPDAACAARQDLAALEAVLRGLPSRTRHVFLLNRVHGRTYADIARALDVSVSTVEKDMMRALAACKASLARREGRP